MLLLSSFAALALVLAGIGIAGVVGYSVVQRTPEIGVRIALGAQRRDVLRLILGQSLAWIVCGVIVARQYFPDTELAEVANKLCDRVEWDWMLDESNNLCHTGYKPEGGMYRCSPAGRMESEFAARTGYFSRYSLM